MSWREGFFSFEERQVVGDVPIDATIRISTESLLMEGARRIDEWSRIADKVPSLSVIPDARAGGGRPRVGARPPAARVGGADDDRRHRATCAASPARWVAASSRSRRSPTGSSPPASSCCARRTARRYPTCRRSRARNRPSSARGRASPAGKPEEALDGRARGAQHATPTSAEAHRAAARAFALLRRFPDAVDVLRRAVQADPLTPAVHLDLGFAAVRIGDFGNARASWEHFLRLAPASPEAGRVNAALETAHAA